MQIRYIVALAIVALAGPLTASAAASSGGGGGGSHGGGAGHGGSGHGGGSGGGAGSHAGGSVSVYSAHAGIAQGRGSARAAMAGLSHGAATAVRFGSAARAVHDERLVRLPRTPPQKLRPQAVRASIDCARSANCGPDYTTFIPNLYCAPGSAGPSGANAGFDCPRGATKVAPAGGMGSRR